MLVDTENVSPALDDMMSTSKNDQGELAAANWSISDISNVYCIIFLKEEWRQRDVMFV